MLRPKGLTLTIIFEAQSLNYDEGYGSNLSVLKKFHRGNGEVFSYSSRQSLRYSIFMQGLREFGWMQSDVEAAGKNESKVIQLTSSIKDSEESDLFGYMQTNLKISDKKQAIVTRTTPVRLLPAIALEPFSSDMEMLTNKYQADKKQLPPNIANMETHRTLYRYSVSVDLHRIGTEADEIGTRASYDGRPENDKDYAAFLKDLRSRDIGAEKKKERVSQLLDVLGRLYRDIKGRREDLKPLFIIGGVYDTLNPFFENIVQVEWEKTKPKLKIPPLSQMTGAAYTIKSDKSKEVTRSVANDTFVGIREGFFANSTSEFESLFTKESGSHVGSPEFAMAELKKQVASYYGQ
jgi:CRISPR-associated protein Cst2